MAAKSSVIAEISNSDRHNLEELAMNDFPPSLIQSDSGEQQINDINMDNSASAPVPIDFGRQRIKGVALKASSTCLIPNDALSTLRDLASSSHTQDATGNLARLETFTFYGPSSAATIHPDVKDMIIKSYECGNGMT